MSSGDWFTSRTSACGLFAACYPRLYNLLILIQFFFYLYPIIGFLSNYWISIQLSDFYPIIGFLFNYWTFFNQLLNFYSIVQNWSNYPSLLQLFKFNPINQVQSNYPIQNLFYCNSKLNPVCRSESNPIKVEFSGIWTYDIQYLLPTYRYNSKYQRCNINTYF